MTARKIIRTGLRRLVHNLSIEMGWTFEETKAIVARLVVGL